MKIPTAYICFPMCLYTVKGIRNIDVKRWVVAHVEGGCKDPYNASKYQADEIQTIHSQKKNTKPAITLASAHQGVARGDPM